MRLYLAGPMRGYDLWNFPAFDRYAAELRQRGHRVVSPAELDRDAGFDEHDERLPDGFIAGAMRRDVAALLEVDAVALMPGWRDSSGVAIEITVAEALGLPVYEIDFEFDLIGIESESILQEAQRLVHGDRGVDYGHPADDFARTGRMWGAILGVPDVAPELVGLCMAAVKISRQVNRPKRDNLTDLCGYAETVAMCIERREAMP